MRVLEPSPGGGGCNLIHMTFRGSRSLPQVLLVGLLASPILPGCQTDEAARYYGSQRYPARDALEVEVLDRKPERPFSVIADIQAYNVSPDHMRRRAAEIGGDAVILVRGGGAYDRNEVWASSDRYSQTYVRLLATVIKYN